ncbi:hypothetical protein MIB92_17505, partial [Aestuariirhabdus sp. Z084]|uniref:hypothetical protein n=1 Tax=Aestuariirhabdus haliotis TaxID=2918751 RepID=UPI0020BFFCB0
WFLSRRSSPFMSRPGQGLQHREKPFLGPPYGAFGRIQPLCYAFLKGLDLTAKARRDSEFA